MTYLINRIWSVYKYYINSVYVLYKDSIFKGWYEKMVKIGDAQRAITNYYYYYYYYYNYNYY